MVHAQLQRRVWTVGLLSPRSRPAGIDRDANFHSFQRGLRELGYIENKNVRFEYRFADGQMDRLPALAAELVQLNVDVIVAAGNQAISAAKTATTTVPIVIATSIDPVGSGFVSSLARPGGNITGLSNLTGDIAAKHLELLANAVPGLNRAAILINPTNSAHAVILDGARGAAPRLHIRLLEFAAGSTAEIETAFAAMAKQRAAGVLVSVDGLFSQEAARIARLALKHRLATIYANATVAEAGGMLGYGQDFADNYRRAAAYVDKILKGARPADLPVEQSTKLVLTINRKTATSLGISIPSSLLIRADRVIE
jgi:putative ABC transport system substrate-binding protein